MANKKSNYWSYYVPVEGNPERVKCDIGQCEQTVTSAKLSNAQSHIKLMHKAIYDKIDKSKTPATLLNQPTLDSLLIATPGKTSGATRDFLMMFASSKMPINTVSNECFKVSSYLIFIYIFQKFAKRVPNFKFPGTYILSKRLLTAPQVQHPQSVSFLSCLSTSMLTRQILRPD